MIKCPKCGANTTATSGGNAGVIYCNYSAKLVGYCDNVKRT